MIVHSHFGSSHSVHALSELCNLNADHDTSSWQRTPLWAHAAPGDPIRDALPSRERRRWNSS